jgi:leucyl-tRNA synthetase
LLKALHKTIKKVTEDVEGFKFNTAIASLMELVNAIYQAGADKEVFSKLIIMLSPFAPHFAEELWQLLGHTESILKAGWPKYDPLTLTEEKVTLVIQVNGKVRTRIEVPSDITEEKLKTLILNEPKIQSWVQNKPLKNFVIVPGRLVNIVI